MHDTSLQQLNMSWLCKASTFMGSHASYNIHGILSKKNSLEFPFYVRFYYIYIYSLHRYIQILSHKIGERIMLTTNFDYESLAPMSFYHIKSKNNKVKKKHKVKKIKR